MTQPPQDTARSEDVPATGEAVDTEAAAQAADQAGTPAGETPPAPGQGSGPSTQGGHEGSVDGGTPGGPSADGQASDGPVEDDPVDQMQNRISELTGDLQRLQAEYVNYKRRVDRDRDVVLQNARITVLNSLLPVLDDIDRAREHEELTGGFKAVAEGVERVVAGAGMEKFGAPGDEFDPRLHEALSHSYADPAAGITTTTCQHVVQAGYRYGERVVRPAKVTVVDPSPEAPAGDAGDAAPEATGDTGAG